MYGDDLLIFKNTKNKSQNTIVKWGKETEIMQIKSESEKMQV